jgi:lantibiotic modifying enzyme
MYEGTSGVALFLAELSVATNDAGAHRTALGAIRQAIRATASDPRGPGLYSGSAGVAFVAARVARTLADEELTQAARQLAAALASRARDVTDYDLIDGWAGTLLALLHLAPLVDDPSLVDAAVALGDALIGAADAYGDGLSWPTKTSPSSRNLTGFAHGAAGAGYALVELGFAAGESRFTRAGERAFDYERGTFDSAAGNWPDFRDSIPRAPADGPGFSASWCHGGPGIALSRLAALERIGGNRWRRDAVAGLTVARDAIMRSLGRIGGDFTLCHGLAGLAEIVSEVARALGDPRAASAAAAEQVAAWGVDEYASRGEWPCGTGSRESPGLMLGLSGIGYFYLRAAGHRSPSVLRPFASGAPDI